MVYLKPALLGNESRDIYNYSRCHEDFPHESTSDQWFNESQFESYRALGQRVADWIYSWKSSTIPPTEERAEVLEDFVKQAHTATETPSPPDVSHLFEAENPA